MTTLEVLLALGRANLAMAAAVAVSFGGRS